MAVAELVWVHRIDNCLAVADWVHHMDNRLAAEVQAR